VIRPFSFDHDVTFWVELHDTVSIIKLYVNKGRNKMVLGAVVSFKVVTVSIAAVKSVTNVSPFNLEKKFSKCKSRRLN